jgi:hypothetical protein
MYSNHIDNNLIYNTTFKNFVVTYQIMDKYKETKSEPKEIRCQVEHLQR